MTDKHETKIARRFSVTGRLTLMVTVLSALAAIAVGTTSYMFARDLTLERTSLALKSTAEIEAGEVSDYVAGIELDLRTLAAGKPGQEVLSAFASSFDALGSDATERLQALYITDNRFPTGEKQKLDDPGDGSTYSAVHADWHATLRAVQEFGGYYDLFLIDPMGRIVYSVFKETDYATDLTTGPWSASGLGRVFRAARDGRPGAVAFDDFAPYGPSADAPASFMAIPVHDAAQSLIGVIALQMPVDRINALIGKFHKPKIGQESYLIGPDGLLRADAQSTPESDVLTTRLTLPDGHETEVVQTLNPSGAGVIAAVARLDYPLIDWRVVTVLRETSYLAPVEEKTTYTIVLVLSVIAVATLAAYLNARRFASPIVRLQGAVDEIAEGKFITIPGSERSDEIGELARQLSALYVHNAHSDRMTAAMDAASAKFMVANGKRNIVYINGSLLGALREMTDDIRAFVPDFDADNLTDRSIDIFHKLPARQA
ncbi:MAG: cache and HAMP domain-containing protein, partial [Pseudomonadota bacterium]